MIQWNNPFNSGNSRKNFKYFKEERLPWIIAGVAALLIIIFIIGSISNAVKRNRIAEEAEIAAAEQNMQEKDEQDAQVAQLLQQANTAAMQYDYDSALSILSPVSQYADQYPELKQAIDDYSSAKASLVAWSDPSQVPNLSFQMLIADPAIAFNDEDYSTSFNRYYVTTTEFSNILIDLYANDYVLVHTKDLYTTQGSEDGAISYMANTIYLPAGKKPIIITQTNVNYDQYLIDKNKDGNTDDGRGFASKLMIQNGKPVNEMFDQNGNSMIGEYDLIPILDSFVRAHPDFSYKGAKATVAVTGAEGLFGYRIANGDQTQINQAAETAQWLKENGYELACYTYGNIAYGSQELSVMRADLTKWDETIAPILGETDILVFARRSDLPEYAGGKFEILLQHGFRYYIGFCEDGTPWSKATIQYVRQGQLLVGGASIAHHSEWFSGMFDTSAVLDHSRGTVPDWVW